MSTLAFILNNCIQISIEDGLQIINEQFPEILFPNEKLIFAFRNRGGLGRDSLFFTSSRFLHVDRQGLVGKRVKYLTVPYKSIKAFSVETVGTIDDDVELTLYCSGGIGKISLAFVADVDIFAINMFLSRVLLQTNTTECTKMPETHNISGGGILEMLWDNNVQIDASVAQNKFQNILIDNEEVELAFRCGRDSFILTNMRMIKVDVKGLTGKKVEFLSIKWNTVRAFYVETAGKFDWDCDIAMFTSISCLNRIEMDLKKGEDVYAVHTYLTDKILGMDEGPSSKQFTPDGRASVSRGSKVGNFLSWLGDDNKTIDAATMDLQYHNNPKILQNNERVEMAFKGRRDLVLFTNKRLLVIDLQGFSGKKIKYVTIPWTIVQAFGVRSAGSFMDKDSEAFVLTDLNDCIGGNVNDPRMSYLEFDFQKDRNDIMVIQKYLSERCMRGSNAAIQFEKEPTSLSFSEPGMFESVINRILDDAHEIDPKLLDKKLEHILAHDENVSMAFKCGRDNTIFTNKRILSIDVQGLTGKKVEWFSIPFSSIRAFAVESAGSFDRDAELKLYLKTYWDQRSSVPGSKYRFDFRKGKVNIISIKNYISWKIISTSDSSISNDAYEEAPKAYSIDSFFSWITEEGIVVDPAKVDEKLHSCPCVLQRDETVEDAFKMARDMVVFTTKRILHIDTKGFTGKKVEYKSYPLRYCVGFNVKTQGVASRIYPAESKIYTDVPGSKKVIQRIRDGDKEIWNMQRFLGNKFLDI